MTRDSIEPTLYTRVNKRSTVYIFNRNRYRERVIFVMGDARRFTLREARAEARRLSALMDGGHDPHPYMRREWCDSCNSPWDYVSRTGTPTCLKCKTAPCAGCGKVYVSRGSAAVADRRRYCSKPCARKGLRTLGEHECGQCRAVFRGRPDSANKYCSRGCAFKVQRDDAARRKRGVADRKDRAREARDLAARGLTCVVCGVAFEGWTFEAKYCGEDCRAREYRRRRWRKLAGGATRILASTSGGVAAGERALDAYLAKRAQ